MEESIFSYVKSQESLFDTDEIRVGENWHWNFKNHVQMIFHLKNSQFYTGENDWMRSFKQIMEPILNLSYWAQDIEVKDLVFFTENEDDRVLSFLIKKYHDEVYVRENDIDTLLDDITEVDIDYGGVLVQKGEKRPEVIFLPSIAFGDQTDIMGGPLGFKFSFNPSKLRQMKSKGWGDPANGATISIEELIVLAKPEKDPTGDSGQNKNITSGKNIEVYIVRGSMPEHYLLDNDNLEEHIDQLQIIGFYKNKDGEDQGVILFRKKDSGKNIKFHTSKKVDNRALGRGVGEALLHPQVWTNFLEIHKTKLMEAGSKILPITDDEGFTSRNILSDKENLEVSVLEEGKSMNILPNINPAQIQLFEQSIGSLFENAQAIGSAFDPILGKEPPSGTTFRGQERTVSQGRGFHDRRRGQRAKFIEEIYRDWIIPDIIKKITNGKKFMATLTADEAGWVADQLVTNRLNQVKIERTLNGGVFLPGELQEEEARVRNQLSKGGNKVLLEILKDEFKGIEMRMGINIAAKQKNLVAMTDKILSIFQIAFSNPDGFKQVLQIPGMNNAFNDVLEFSGMSQVDFSNLNALPAPGNEGGNIDELLATQQQALTQ